MSQNLFAGQDVGSLTPQRGYLTLVSGPLFILGTCNENSSDCIRETYLIHKIFHVV